jgi:hypothetical protein
MRNVDPKRLSLHAGTLRPVGRFEEKAELAARAGFGAWALRGVEVEEYVAGGRTIADVRRLNERHGLTVSETGSLMQWQFTGGVPLLNTFKRPEGVSDDELLARADRLLGWTRALGGDTVAAIAAYEADGTVDAGGGVLMIQAIHMIDLLHWVLGMPRRAVARIATAVHAVDVEDVAVGLLEFDGGVMAAVQATTGAVPEQPPSVEIHGDRATATVSGSWGHLALWLRPGTSCSDAQTVAVDPDAGGRRAQPLVEPYAEQIGDFVAAVREGRSPLVDGAEARKALQIVDALYRSAASERWVDVAQMHAPRFRG